MGVLGDDTDAQLSTEVRASGTVVGGPRDCERLHVLAGLSFTKEIKCSVY